MTPRRAPRPNLPCNRCACIKAFRCSGKFRVNAHRKVLDAWLIYQCVDCGKTWNRPVIERRNIRDIDPAMLRALQANAPELVEIWAFDSKPLRRHAHQVEACSNVTLRKEAMSEPYGPWSGLDIVLAVPSAVSCRLDRLLATGLDVPRTRVQKLSKSGRLHIAGHETCLLRRPVRDAMQVQIELSGTADGSAIGVAAIQNAEDLSQPPSPNRLVW